jgi:hypothetical protein
MVWAVGIRAPPKKPWPTRPMIIEERSWLVPQTQEKAVNITTHPSSRVRRPNTRDSQALRGIITTSLTR